jgi:hypothetical protein
MPIQNGGHVIVLHLLRNGYDDLYLRGGFHPNVSKEESSQRIKIKLKIYFTKTDKNILIRQYHEIVDIKHEQDKELLRFWDIPWTELSKETPPKADISIQEINELSESSLMFYSHKI